LDPNAFYTLYLDGSEIGSGPSWLQYSIGDFDTLANHRYHYQLTYIDANGNVSETADTLSTPLLPPKSPLLADNDLHLGVVLIRYADSQVPAEGWSARQAAISNKIFGASPGAYTFRNYIRGASVGQADVTGDTSNWIDLRTPSDPVNGAPLALATDCTTVDGGPSLAAGDPSTFVNCAFGDSSQSPPVILTAQARAAGFPVDNYEKLVFYVAGVNTGDGSLVMGAYGRFMSDPDGLPSLLLLTHEMGHAFGFAHSDLQLCAGPNFFDIEGRTCMSTSPVSRASTGYPTPFDAQVSTAWHMAYWNSDYQYAQGWIPDSQVVYHNVATPDTTYALAPLEAAGGPRQIRIEIDPATFYFAEYRNGTGFDGPGPFDNAVRAGDTFPRISFYRNEVGVSVWLRTANQGGPNHDLPYVAASNMKVGDFYCDPFRNIAVRVVSLDSGSAGVRIERNGTCTPPALGSVCPVDDVKDGSETGVDCGGPCAPCQDNDSCVVNQDCASGFCASGICRSPLCADGAKDGSETGVDCGGPTCATCATGAGCNVDADCQSAACVGGTCVASR
jgi:hypothetical protein